MNAQVQQTAHALAGQLGFRENKLASILEHHAHHVPAQERADVVQHLAEVFLSEQPNTPELAFIIAKRRVANWWRHYKRHSLFGDSEVTYGSENVDDGEGGTREMIDTIADSADYVARFEDREASRVLFGTLPNEVRKAVIKRLRGLGLTATERSRVKRFVDKARSEGWPEAFLAS